jgi:hypothetical protein
MKTALILLPCLFASTSPRAFAGAESGVTEAAAEAIAPAYKAVEELSDGLYEMLRFNLVCGLLPARWTRSLHAAPARDSSERFLKILAGREEDFLERARQAYPVSNAPAALVDPDQLRRWRSWALEEQLRLPAEALQAALLERYGLQPFVLSASRERSGLDPGFLTLAGIAGGSLFYLNGLRAVGEAGPWRIGLNLRPGRRLAAALRGEVSLERFAGLEISRKDFPIVASARAGVARGGLRAEGAGLEYRLRF